MGMTGNTSSGCDAFLTLSRKYSITVRLTTMRQCFSSSTLLSREKQAKKTKNDRKTKRTIGKW